MANKRPRKGDPIKVARNTVGVAGFAALREAGLTVVYTDDIERLARSMPPEKDCPPPTTAPKQSEANKSLADAP